MNIRLTPEAEYDLIGIEEHYLESAAYLPERFLNDLLEHLNFIEEYPKAGKKVRKGYRRFHMSRFPYYIFYEEHKQLIVVVRLVHDKRNPKLILNRIT